MKKIAICGGIGSGKSMVSAVLRESGAFVVSADEVNAELLQEKEYIALIENTFPQVVHNNQINKKELARLIYSDEKSRERLMELSHPLIFDRMLRKAEGEDIVFFEIPLLTKCPIRFDSIWYVSASVEKRIVAIVRRDGVSEEYARKVMSLQSDEDKLVERADVVLVNDYDEGRFVAQVKLQYCSILSQFS